MADEKQEEFTFKFTHDESQIILNSLLKQPCGDVLGVVNKLQLQAAEQMAPEKKE